MLHEDTITGVRATASSAGLPDQLGEEPAIKSEIWKIPVAQATPSSGSRHPPEAIEADMIVVSACGSNLLPSHIKDLIEDALIRKQGRQTAVVALLDWERDPSTQPSPRFAATSDNGQEKRPAWISSATPANGRLNKN